MKTAKDPRHLHREEIVKFLFANLFPNNSLINSKEIKVILSQQEKIDKIVTNTAPEWPLNQINKVDLAILRLAIYELIIKPSEPVKVVIDEAVEIAKKYGSENSPKFINGVLGTVLKNYSPKND